jgi:hypothetical protein
VCYGLVFFSKRFSIQAPLTAEEEAENARVYVDAEELAAAAGTSEGAASVAEPAPEASPPPPRRKKKKG